MSGFFTRRQWLGACGLALAGSCARKKATGYPGYALVATAGEDSLAVIDLLTFQLAKTVGLGAAPTAIASSPDGAQNYVLTPERESIHLLDGEANVKNSQRWADGLLQIQLAPEGKRVIATASANGGQLIDGDARSLQVIRRYALTGPPSSLDVSPNEYVAVSTGKAGTVELFHLPSGERTQAHLSGEIGELRFRSDGRMLLVANYQNRSLVALNVPTLDVVAELPLAMIPQNLCFSTDGGQLFITGSDMDGVAIVFPYQMLEVDQTVLAGRSPGVMACSDMPSYLFVASREVGDVSVLNVLTRKVIGVVALGQKPDFVAVTPDSQYALVLTEKSGDVAVIHIPAIQSHKLTPSMVLSTRIGPIFTVVPVGSQPISATIIPRQA